MRRQGWLVLLGLSLPRLAAASTLGPLAPLGPIFFGFIAVAWLLGIVGILWCCVRSVRAWSNRDLDGMGPVIEWSIIAVVGAVLFTQIIPGFTDSMLARAGEVLP